MISPEEQTQNKNGKSENKTDEIIAVYTQQLAVYTRHLRNATWFLGAVTVLLALIGGFTTAITWNYSDKQIGRMDTSLKDQRDFTEAARDSTHIADSVQRSFDTSQTHRLDSQIGISRNTMIAQLRAYVFVRPLEHPRPDTFEVEIKNIGQTPAYHIRSTFAFQILNRYAKFLPDTGKKIIDSCGVLFNGGAPTGMGGPIDEKNKQLLPYVLNGTSILYFWGTVTYYDIFGIKRHYSYRWRSGHYDPFGMEICPDGNEAD